MLDLLTNERSMDTKLTCVIAKISYENEPERSESSGMGPFKYDLTPQGEWGKVGSEGG